MTDDGDNLTAEQTESLNDRTNVNTREPAERTIVLLERYEDLNHSHYQHSGVIHSTFYLSIAFFAGLLSAVFTVEGGEVIITILSFFAGLIFLILGNWAWRYLRGREEIKNRKRIVKGELEMLDYDMSGEYDIGDTFFFEHNERVEKYKKYFHLSYYSVLSIISFSLGLITSL